jgi:glycerol-1-phosphate dehydrogenase [NAD(P)+]
VNQTDEAFLFWSRVAGTEPSTRSEFEFGSTKVVLVADENTFRAAGKDVLDGFRKEQHDCAEPFVFGNTVNAHHDYVDQLVVALAAVKAVPVAVGSRTINDLTELAASRLNRPYMAGDRRIDDGCTA